MKKLKILFISASLLICLALVVSGCGEPAGKGKVLASIGGNTITVADFNERMSNLPAKFQEIVKTRKGDYLDELINDTLLYQEARRKGLHKDKETLRVIEEAQRKILIAKLLKDEISDTIVIEDEDIQVYYQNHENEFMTPEIMRVSHILVTTQEEAEKLLKELDGGASFDELARAKSVDPTAQRGGDIGYFPKGQLMPDFENACAQLDIGETSGVVKTQLGYHIIKLTDRKPPQLRPLEQIKENVRARIYAEKRQENFDKLLGRLREETKIKIDAEALSGLEIEVKDEAQ